jgi:hypothetical protein
VPALHVSSLGGRLLALATVYHLGRPGSELDATTLERHQLGLSGVLPSLEAQLDRPAVEVELTDYQLHRLGEALLGVVNELKQFEMSEGRSVVPGFSAALARLFPDATADHAGGALELVAHAMGLRRRLDIAIREASANVEASRAAALEQASRERRRWWQRWRR